MVWICGITKWVSNFSLPWVSLWSCKHVPVKQTKLVINDQPQQQVGDMLT